MTALTRREDILRKFMLASAITYFLVGLAFALIPHQIFGAINWLSLRIAPGFELIPPSVEKFWLALGFSLMMTIAALCFFAYRNIRENINLIVPLLISKAVTSLTSLVFFIVSARYFAYLVIFVVDGSIFWITLVFFILGYRAYIAERISYARRKAAMLKRTAEVAKVVVAKGDEKIAALDRVLEDTRFFEVLDQHYTKSRKSKADFLIAIKPNFMFAYHKKDISTYTDPEFVEHLIDRIAGQGFSNIAIVESQSTYGNYYKNREVEKVAVYLGYSANKNYRIVDLTQERVSYDYGGRLGKHFVGPTWRDADFRISFAKNKTHVFCYYTLTLKNIYGTLPLQNKLKEYHTKREYDWPTIETLKDFPVHFGLIDAFYSADGTFGVIMDRKPNHTKTIIGGENLIAVDWVGASKMGLDPMVGRFLPLAVEAWGLPIIDCIGDESEYHPWENAEVPVIEALDVIEEAYAFSDWAFSTLVFMDPFFPAKRQTVLVKFMRWILRPIKRTIYPRHIPVD